MPADHRSSEALRGLADERDLTFVEEGKPPSGASMGRSDAVAHAIAAGELPGGITGLVADLAYKVTPKQEGDPTEAHSTVLITRVPESVGFIPALTAHDARSRNLTERLVGAGGLIPLFDRIEMESTKFNTTYRIGILKMQDENWVRQLFSPSFVDYLAEQAPDGCYFNLWGGLLHVASNEPVKDREELEHFCEFGAHIAARIRSEALENEGNVARVPAGAMYEKAQADLDEKLDEVSFDTPPTDVASAAKRYRPVARRGKAGWLMSFVIAAIVAVIPAGFLGLLVAGFLDNAVVGGAVFLAVGVPVFLAMFVGLARAQLRSASTRYGLHAFLRAYGAEHGLTTVNPAELQVEHMRLPMPGAPERVLAGRLPRAELEGELGVFGLNYDKQMPATLAAIAGNGGVGGLPLVQLAPSGATQGAVAVAGFFVLEAKGVSEPARIRDARERMREQLGDALAGHYEVVADPEAAEAVSRAITPEVRRELIQGFDGEPLYLALAGNDVLVHATPSSVRDWSTETLDSFCEAAGRVIREVRAASGSR